MTREVQACRAKTQLARLLDAVERGETIVITRHGRRIARIVPEAERRQYQSVGKRNQQKTWPHNRRRNQQETAAALRELWRLAIVFDQSPDGPAVMALARRHRLTVYHAAYLALAMRQALPLATLDAALTRAARAQSVALLGSAPG